MTQITETNRHPLTLLSPDEELFRSSVRQFARERMAPWVREMDEKGIFRQDLLDEFFRMGWMGIEIPESYGGSEGTFFHCVLVIEELAAVDPSAGVIVDVQNTLVNNALLRWGNEEQKKRYLPRLAENTVGAYALDPEPTGYGWGEKS